MARQTTRVVDEKLALTLLPLVRAVSAHHGALDGPAESLEGVAGGPRDLAAAVEAATDAFPEAEAKEPGE
jgi:hypothetical protein